MFLRQSNLKGGKTTALYILHYSRKMVNEAPKPWQPSRAANRRARTGTVANGMARKGSGGGASRRSKFDGRSEAANHSVGKHRTAVGRARLRRPMGLLCGPVCDLYRHAGQQRSFFLSVFSSSLLHLSTSMTTGVDTEEGVCPFSDLFQQTLTRHPI